MNYWRDLKCDNYDAVNQEILVWIQDCLPITEATKFWNFVNIKIFLNSCTLFGDWIDANKLYLRSIAVTYGTHVHCCTAHVDTPPARYKLSWPVKNTRGSWNRWFKETGLTESDTNYLGGKVYKTYTNLEEVARKEVLTPCLIDASIPHDVWYPITTEINFPRIGLQCQLFKEPKTL